MKTLIIHPTDKTTDFLKPIYKNIPNKTLVTGGNTKDQLKELILKHDRTIMMGHGCPSGLFGVGQFPDTRGLIIDKTFVDVLSEGENIYIWCNSHRFVNDFGLKGFYSGMFISEVGESEYCGIPSEQNVVDESNDGFSNILSKYVTESIDTIFHRVRKEYGLLTSHNRIARYNHQRLFVNL